MKPPIIAALMAIINSTDEDLVCLPNPSHTRGFSSMIALGERPSANTKISQRTGTHHLVVMERDTTRPLPRGRCNSMSSSLSATPRRLISAD